MASSSRSIKKPQQIGAPRDIQATNGFRSLEEQTWYHQNFATRAVLPERTANIMDLDDFAFKQTFTRRAGWVDFLRNNSGICNKTICREFVASLVKRPNTTNEFAAFVRGKAFDINPVILGNFIGIEPLENYVMPYALNAEYPDEDDIARMLTGNPRAVWEGDTLLSNRLTKEFYKLWKVVGNTISPNSHQTRLNREDVLLVYHIAKNDDICLVQFLLKKMTSPYIDRNATTAIKLGVLITRFCLMHGRVASKTEDQMQKPMGPVSNAMMNRSRGHLQQEQPIAEGGDEDEGEEEEQEEMPPPPPRRTKRRTEAGEGSSSTVDEGLREYIAQLIQGMEERSVARDQAISNMQAALATNQTQLAMQLGEFIQKMEAQYTKLYNEVQDHFARCPPPPPPQ